MPFRLRRSARLGPLRFHFTAAGLSSIAIGRSGANVNVPVNRRGGTRTTLSLPGTGLSWSNERSAADGNRSTSLPAGTALAQATTSAATLPNSRRLRPSQLQVLRQRCLQLLLEQLFAAGSEPRRLWQEGLVSRLLVDSTVSGRLAGTLALIETPQALEGYLERARSQDDLKRRSQRCVSAAQEALRLSRQRGWLD